MRENENEWQWGENKMEVEKSKTDNMVAHGGAKYIHGVLRAK